MVRDTVYLNTGHTFYYRSITLFGAVHSKIQGDSTNQQKIPLFLYDTKQNFLIEKASYICCNYEVFFGGRK